MEKKLQIQDFYIEKKLNKINLYYKVSNDWKMFLFDGMYSTFLINSISDNFDGIIININNKNNSYQIKTSIIGSINVFHYKSGENIYLGTDLDYLIKQSRFKKSYNPTKLYDYFALSYHALDDKTIYNGINIIPKNSLIKVDNQIQIKTDFSEKIYSNLNYDVHFDDILDSLISFSKSTLLNSIPSKNLLLLSGGKDSIIGALLLRLHTKKISTSTYGFNLNTNDIISGYKRSEKLFKNSVHHEFLLEKLEYNKNDFDQYGIALGGYGPFSSISYYKYFKSLQKIGFENYFFSCHYECLRKKIVDDDYFITNNTTPQNVVNKFFKDKKHYDNNLDELKFKIQNKYKIDPYYQFYFYDRNIQGGYYKSLLSRKFGLRNITLSNNANFLNLNYNFIKQNEMFTYDKILDELLRMNNIKKESVVFNNLTKSKFKDIAINPINDLRVVKNIYLNQLELNKNSLFAEMFDFPKIKETLINENFDDYDHWFLLRLFQILNYKNL
jgi:hypothetical protein